jgi:hypothetical protein
MIMKLSLLYKFVLPLALFSIVISSCKKDEEEEMEMDQNMMLYSETKSTDGYTYWRNGELLSPKGSSPHGTFKLRLNDVAQAALDSNGVLPAGKSFPENSIIVKESIKNGAVDLIIPMKKVSSHSNAALGWVWAEYRPGGDVVYSIAKNGEACTGCHSAPNHRDHTLTFSLH